VAVERLKSRKPEK